MSARPSMMEMGFPRPFIRDIAAKLNVTKDKLKYITVEFSLNPEGKSIVTFRNAANTKTISHTENWLYEKIKNVRKQTDKQLMWAQVSYNMACEVGIEQLPRANMKNYQQNKVYPLSLAQAKHDRVTYRIHAPADFKDGQFAVMSTSSKSNIRDFNSSRVVKRQRLLDGVMKISDIVVDAPVVELQPAPTKVKSKPAAKVTATKETPVDDKAYAIELAQKMPAQYRYVVLESLLAKIKQEDSVDLAIKNISN